MLILAIEFKTKYRWMKLFSITGATLSYFMQKLTKFKLQKKSQNTEKTDTLQKCHNA